MRRRDGGVVFFLSALGQFGMQGILNSIDSQGAARCDAAACMRIALQGTRAALCHLPVVAHTGKVKGRKTFCMDSLFFWNSGILEKSGNRDKQKCQQKIIIYYPVIIFREEEVFSIPSIINTSN